LALGLDVDQHLGARQAAPDVALDLVRDRVRALERRARRELEVEVDVASASGTSPAQLVKPG
jgi:hypothetical protein